MAKMSPMFLLCLALVLTSCQDNRSKLIEGAAQIAELPDFATRSGSSGSSVGRHYYYDGEFYIDPVQYKSEDGTVLKPEEILWDIFQRYGRRVQKNIPYDQLPNMIAKGGSSKPGPTSTHFEFKFDSTDVSIHYDVEWVIRGCNPKAWSKNEMEPRPEVRVLFHIRLN